MTDPLSYQEQELIIQVAGGNETAFRILYDRYWNTVYSTSLTYTKSADIAQEIVQETFIRVWKSRDRLPAVDNLAAYIFVIARNRIKTYLKTNKIFVPVDGFAERALREEGLSADRNASIRQFRDLVYQALDRLPAQQSAVFRMSRFEDLSYEEIAEKLHISTSTVRLHLIKALNFMRSHFSSRSVDLVIILTLLADIF